MAVKPVPDGFHTVTPYLLVKGASGLMEFLKRAFDAQETERMTTPDGTVAHGEMRIGDSMVMLAEASGSNKPVPAMLFLYVPDVDGSYRRALQAGATPAREVRDEFYGDRVGAVDDGFGNQWWLASHIEDVSPEEMARRRAARGG